MGGALAGHPQGRSQDPSWRGGEKQPPGPDGKAQRRGPGGHRGAVGCRAPSHASLGLSSRARACPQPSASQEGPSSTGASMLAAGKEDVFGELSRVRENHQRLLPVSPWLESSVTGAPKGRPGRSPGAGAGRSHLGEMQRVRTQAQPPSPAPHIPQPNATSEGRGHLQRPSACLGGFRH